MNTASHQQKAKKNRDVARINRQSCEVKGTLSIHMAMKACGDVSLEVSELVSTCPSPITLKRKMEEMAGKLSRLDQCLVNAKKCFQLGGKDLCGESDYNASYEEGNLNRCILNGKDPKIYTGISNFTPEMLSIYKKLHFDQETDPNTPPLSHDIVTPGVSSVNDSPSQVEDSNSDASSSLLQTVIPAFQIDPINRIVLGLDSPLKFGQTYYSPFQAKTIINRVEQLHGQKVKVDVMRFIIASKYVPVKRTALYHALSSDINEKSEWFFKGAPSKVDIDLIMDCILQDPDGPRNGKNMGASKLYALIKKHYKANCTSVQQMHEFNIKPLANITIRRIANKMRAAEKFSNFTRVANCIELTCT